eukprot:Em0009g1304a
MPDLKSVSKDDQKSFVNILVGELTSQFSILQHQIDDPLLNDTQNLSLHRKVFIQVCSTFEKLYSRYLAKAATALTKKAVFTMPANLSRLKVQLMLEANKSLNIPTIRRSIIGQLRGPPLQSQSLSPQLPPILKWETLNISGALGLGDPLSKKLLKIGVNPRSITKVTDHSCVVSKPELQVPRPSSTVKFGALHGGDPSKVLGSPGEGVARPLPQLPKSKSMPNLEEMMSSGIDNISFRAGENQQVMGYKRALSVESIMNLKMDTSENTSEMQAWTYEHTLLGRFTNSEVDKDLKRLCNEWTTSSSNDDLDPVLQAQVHALSKSQVHRLQAQQRPVGKVSVRCIGSGNPIQGSGVHLTTNLDSEIEASTHTTPNVRCDEGSKAKIGGRDAQTQPSVITSVMNGETLTRTSDVRVSERGALTSLRLKPSPPVYNELTGELEQSMIRELDQNLNEGRDLMSLYEEVLRALPKNHLDFVRESQPEPTILHAVNLSKVLASDTLHHRRSRRVVNRQLHQSIQPPWELTNTSKKVWEESQPHQRQQDEKRGRSSSMKNTRSLRHSGPGRTVMDSQDYFKFVSRQATDYLGLVYHLYDSDGTDSETEEEKRVQRQKLAELHCRLKAREAKRKQQYQLKSNFESGQWNVNAVMMGGLGGDPELSSSEEDLESLTRKLTHAEGTCTDKSVQERLCSIWNHLHFLPAQQMDMAVKYSSEEFSGHLNTALDAWEHACAAIETREEALMELQSFEEAASDPARFFARGHLGSSVARLEEAKRRDRLHQALDQRDQEVSQIIRKIFCEYGDRVSYNGRLYQEKMTYDRTEMLYWLQQERRKEVLKPAIRTLHIEVPHLYS